MRDGARDQRGAGDLQPLVGARPLRHARATCPTTCWRALPANGGVCMVTFVPEFVSPATAAWRRSRPPRPRPRSASTPGTERPSGRSPPRGSAGTPSRTRRSTQVVAHLEHVREVAGIDHVGIGGDYDGTDTFPVGLEDVSGYPRLVAALLDRGWSDADVAGSCAATRCASCATSRRWRATSRRPRAEPAHHRSSSTARRRTAREAHCGHCCGSGRWSARRVGRRRGRRRACRRSARACTNARACGSPA